MHRPYSVATGFETVSDGSAANAKEERIEIVAVHDREHEEEPNQNKSTNFQQLLQDQHSQKCARP